MQFVFHCITADLTGTAKTAADKKKQNSTPYFTPSSSRFSLRQFEAREIFSVLGADLAEEFFHRTPRARGSDNPPRA